MSKLKSRFLGLLMFMLCSTLGVAQINSTSDSNTPKDNSPYSRIGIGDLVNRNFAGPLGMGGLGASFNDPYHTNLINPASYSYLRSTSFEVGLFSQYSSLQTPSETLDIWSGNINYISIGFPMRNPINEVLDRKKRDTHWGMNLSLLPFSTVGYNVQSNGIIEESGQETINSFNGRGGTYKVQWGNAVKYKDFSVGVNLSYFFGKIINERSLFLVGTGSSYSSKFLDELSMGGVTIDAGVQYKYQFKEKNDKGEIVPNGKSFTVGAYAGPNSSINTNTSQFYTRRNSTFGTLDTLVNVNEIRGDATLPGSFGVGVMYENFNKFRVGIDYSASKWSNYSNDAKPETLLDSYRIAIGGEIIPDENSYKSYARKIRYRLGAYYETDPRNINEQLTNYGITLGLGFPVILPRQQKSFFNLALEAGKFGANTSIEETYIKATFGFTLNDNTWFFKRKFE